MFSAQTFTKRVQRHGSGSSDICESNRELAEESAAWRPICFIGDGDLWGHITTIINRSGRIDKGSGYTCIE